MNGLTAARLPYVAVIPPLAAVLPDPFDPEEAAAAHHDLFAFNLFPYAGIFLTDSGLLGGDVTNQVAQAYRQAGFSIGASTASPDHLGHAFAFLAFLAEREAEAWPLQPAGALLWQQKQHHFLARHLLLWLIPCAIAVQQQANRFYSELAQWSLILALTHFAEGAAASVSGGQQPPDLPDNPPLLDDERAGLKEIARYLITPLQSGIYLGRHDIGQLARRLELPRGFGNREQMLLNLMRAAGQYDQASQLFTLIGAVINRWQLVYDSLSVDFPDAAAFVQPWQSRTAQAQHLLNGMLLQAN